MRIPLRQLVVPLLCALLFHASMLQAQDVPASEMLQTEDVPSATLQTEDGSPSDLLQAQDDPVAEVLRQSLEGMEQEIALGVDVCRSSSWAVMPRLYKRREYRPIWTSPVAVYQFVAAIRESYDEGLNPHDYNLNEILESLRENPIGQASDPTRAAFLDMLLTDAFIRLASHTLFGREDPATYHPQWKIENTPVSEDLVDYFEKALAFPSITRIVDSWKVSYVYYKGLKKALAAYRAIRARGGWQRLPEGKRLKMGDSDQGVPALRRRLAAEYPGLGLPLGSPFFDAGLARAVRHFQARHGITQDGSVGGETLRAMNVPVEGRIDQIRINLERCRWVMRKLGDTFVLVDIVGFNVYVHENGRIVWSGRAQVGQPYRDTPMLKSEITYIEFNPTWTIPPTVRDEDVLPAVKKDPGYLKKHHITVIDYEGMGFVTPPTEVKWALYPEQPFPYRLVQNPGADNPLGRIKIIFPNKHRVYLHDTPSKFLFDRQERTFSSGCIRVERPFEFASRLFPGFCGWTPGKLQKAAGNGFTWRLDLPLPVPILLLYSTVTVDTKGVPFFRKDLYNHDPVVLKGLGPDPRFVPGDQRRISGL